VGGGARGRLRYDTRTEEHRKASRNVGWERNIFALDLSGKVKVWGGENKKVEIYDTSKVT